MTDGTPLDLLRGGELYCGVCGRTLRSAFEATATGTWLGDLFCRTLTWLDCEGCEDPGSHRVCDSCLKQYKIERAPRDGEREAWAVCPDALVVAQKMMGRDTDGRPKLNIDGVPYSITGIADSTTIVLDDKIRPKEKWRKS